MGVALAERRAGATLPEPWELAHQDALDLARTAAVEESLGNHAASRDAYAQVRPRASVLRLRVLWAASCDAYVLVCFPAARGFLL